MFEVWRANSESYHGGEFARQPPNTAYSCFENGISYLEHGRKGVQSDKLIKIWCCLLLPSEGTPKGDFFLFLSYPRTRSRVGADFFTCRGCIYSTLHIQKIMFYTSVSVWSPMLSNVDPGHYQMGDHLDIHNAVCRSGQRHTPEKQKHS